jgi:hypothetical protein
METQDLFAKRQMSKPRQVNFLVGAQAGEQDQKALLVELDPSFECRVGILFTAMDKRTGKRYLLRVADINPAYAHRDEHAEMLDLLRRRSDKEIDNPTFNALCKNMATCALIGEIQDGQIVERGYRPNKYTTTATVADAHIEALLVADWQEGVQLGHLRLGHDRRPNLSVHLPTTSLVGARLLLAGKTGVGKSTAMMQLLVGHANLTAQFPALRRVGFLVDDFKMEYPFGSYNQHKQRVLGLVDRLGATASRSVVILTCAPQRYQKHAGAVRAILDLKIPLDSVSLSVFADLANLTPAQEAVVRLVEDAIQPSQFFDDLLAVDAYGMPDIVRWKKYGPLFHSKKGREKARKGEQVDAEDDIDSNIQDRLQYIRRAAQRLLNMPFMCRSAADKRSCIPELLSYLREGCIVIVDKDGLEDHQRQFLSVVLLYHLFRHNQKLAAGTEEQRKSMIPVVVAVEEAQYLLSEKKVADPDSIFAKIAFTGRSYQIGLIAITQRPQAIQKELLGQFDGFLVLPMEHVNDFKHLADACPALSGYRQDLAAAPIGGAVLAMGFPKRVVSLQIDADSAIETDATSEAFKA